jgi:predicted RNA binding protein YcfA (HicA-like mRNA interferase family)
MTKKKLLQQIINNRNNIDFNDFILIVESFGFVNHRKNGSHIMYKHRGVAEVLNLQEVKGKAKPYQIKQFLNYVEKYNLKMED